MAADLVWQLYPTGAGSTPVDVWVEGIDSRPLSVAPTVRGGELPKSTRTIRIRWRSGFAITARLIDQDDNLWLVDGLREQGRRQWLDVQVSSYQDAATGMDVTEPVAPSDFTAPAGWLLQDANGDPVQQLTMVGFPLNDIGQRYGFQVERGEGWQTESGEEWSATTRVPVTVNQVQTYLVFVGIYSPPTASQISDLSGTRWLRSMSVALAFSGGGDRQSVSVSTLNVGDVVTVESA